MWLSTDKTLTIIAISSTILLQHFPFLPIFIYSFFSFKKKSKKSDDINFWAAFFSYIYSNFYFYNQKKRNNNNPSFFPIKFPFIFTAVNLLNHKKTFALVNDRLQIQWENKSKKSSKKSLKQHLYTPLF